MNQFEPKFIGKRITVKRAKGELIIEISQQVKRWQESLLLVWLMAWIFCGVVFIYFSFTSVDFTQRIVSIIAVGMWIYFLIRIGRVFLWRKKGKEVISLSNGKMTLYNAHIGQRKKEVFSFHNIFKLGIIKREPTNFLAFIDDSFWIIGGDRVGFSYSGQPIKFGKQLSVRDAELLVRVVESGLREYK